MLPIVRDWARRIRTSPSKLLMPLSFAAVLGGMCTLVGTSTNLVISGLATDLTPAVEIGMFDITLLGLPVALLGALYVALMSRPLLPGADQLSDHPTPERTYSIEVLVEPEGSTIGRTLRDLGIDSLPGLTLNALLRERQSLYRRDQEDDYEDDTPSSLYPLTQVMDQKLTAEDRLLFSGGIENVVDLRKVRGLTSKAGVQSGERPKDRKLVEAALSARSSYAGMELSATSFEKNYQVELLAVHRRGQHLAIPPGELTLKPGDVLALDAPLGFSTKHEGDTNFSLLREVENSQTIRYDRAGLSAFLVIAMVALSATGKVPLVTAAFAAAALLIVSQCLPSSRAYASLEGRVLVTIASSFGVAAAISNSELDVLFASGLTVIASELGMLALLFVIYGASALLTELITNNSAAALMFPFCAATADQLSIDPKPLFLVLMVAASASFSTPIGYQTNMIVMAPGGYEFKHYLKFGGPLQLLIGTATVLLAYMLWFAR